MKKLILLLIVLISGFGLYDLNAQNLKTDSKDSDYYSEMKSHFVDLVKKDASKQKKYLRAEAKTFKKLDASNSLISYKRAMSALCSNVCVTPDDADWQSCGPDYYHVGNTQWNGYVEEVSIDPTQLNQPDPMLNCLLGTETSGIFKYDGTQWVNKTDGLDEYGLGISEILRDSNNPSTILVSTGLKDYSNSNGIIKSMDNGDNWFAIPMFDTFDPCRTQIRGIYLNYDLSGQPLSIDNHFFVISTWNKFPFNSFGWHHDQLWEYCNGIWIDRTPQEYIDMTINAHNYGNLYNNHHLNLFDFTASPNSMILTTTAPYTNDGAFLFYAVKPGVSCTTTPTWSEITPSIGISSSNQVLSISDWKPNKIFARTKGNDNNNLYQSVDGGLTWTTLLTSIGGGARKLDIEYSPASNQVYIGHAYNPILWIYDLNLATLYSAPNSTMHVDVRDFSISGTNTNNQEVVAIANDGGVSLLLNNLTTGVKTYQPVSGTSMSIHQAWGIGITQETNMKKAAGMMHNHSFYHDGTSWCKFGSGDGGDIEVNHTDNETIYFSINPNIRKGNLNNICGSLGTNIFTTNQWQFGRPLELDPDNQCKLYFGNDKNASMLAAELIRYDDCNSPAITVLPLDNVTGNNAGQYMNEIGAIGIAESNSQVIYLGSHGSKAPGESGIFIKSTDGGLTWLDLSNSDVTDNSGTNSLTNSIGWMSIEDIVVSPYDENLVILSISGTRTGLRVLWSFDGGFNFYDYSPGLPDIPVNTLEYFKNSNDLLSAGTDAGVYYRDNTMSEWVCFTENLPKVWTTDLDINYCNNTLVAATHGRGIYETSLNTLTNVRRFHRITSNTTWNYDKVIYSDIIVEPGVTLDIVNATIKFAGGKRIIVNPTAQLNVINAELTNLCDNLCWDGITIEGDSNQPQTLAFQGKAYLNGSTLSNAKNAINILGVDETTPNLDTDWSQMGGIIQALSSTFINNRRAAQFLSYENIVSSSSSSVTEVSNVSIFDQCNFIVDDDYLNSCGSNSPHITMWHVNGITIKNCTFEDRRNTLTIPSDYREGISGGNSAINAFNNTFIKLFKGIHLDDIQATFPITSNIKKNNFYNCETAIRLTNYNKDAEICDNYVSIGHPKATSSYGIVAHNSSGFIICDNVCEKDNTYPQWTQAYDILNTINSSNPNSLPFYPHNLVVNNTSINNNNGFVAWGDNMALDGQGLEFICNTNIGNTNFDFRFLDCIQIDQGSTLYPAGNTFSGGSVLPIAFDNSLPWTCDVSPLPVGTAFNYFLESPSSIVFPPAVNVITTNNITDCSNYVPCAFIQVFDEDDLSGTFEVENTIYATGNVGDVTFSAGERITLLPGFSTSSSLKCATESCECNLSAPDNLIVDNANATNISLSWNAVPGATEYYIEYTVDSGTPAFHYTTNNNIIIPFAVGIDHQYTVFTDCGESGSQGSTVMFTTRDGCADCDPAQDIEVSFDENGNLVISWDGAENASNVIINLYDQEGNPLPNGTFEEEPEGDPVVIPASSFEGEDVIEVGVSVICGSSTPLIDNIGCHETNIVVIVADDNPLKYGPYCNQTGNRIYSILCSHVNNDITIDKFRCFHCDGASYRTPQEVNNCVTTTSCGCN